MKIFEAAEKALRELGAPTHQSVLRRYIEANGYYVFGAKESASVLGVELSRRASNVQISKASPEKIFYRDKSATYGLCEWLDSPDRMSMDASIEADVAEILSGQIGPTTREQLILARIGQGAFREGVLSLWGQRCAVTGTIFAVRASHVKPWRNCTDIERLDPNNGLPLVATIDALFDAHLISFDSEGCIILSSKVPNHEQRRLGIDSEMRLREVPSSTLEFYLKCHRQLLRD